MTDPNLAALFGNPSKDAIAMATATLTKVVAYDPRFQALTEGVILGWAECLERSGAMWLKELLDGVAAHYDKPNVFPPCPGDITSYALAQPVWSSPDHAYSALVSAASGYSRAQFRELLGYDPLPQEFPADVDWRYERDWMAQWGLRWVEKNRDELVQRVCKLGSDGLALPQPGEWDLPGIPGPDGESDPSEGR